MISEKLMLLIPIGVCAGVILTAVIQILINAHNNNKK